MKLTENYRIRGAFITLASAIALVLMGAISIPASAGGIDACTAEEDCDSGYVENNLSQDELDSLMQELQGVKGGGGRDTGVGGPKSHSKENKRYEDEAERVKLIEAEKKAEAERVAKEKAEAEAKAKAEAERVAKEKAEAEAKAEAERVAKEKAEAEAKAAEKAAEAKKQKNIALGAGAFALIAVLGIIALVLRRRNKE